MCKLCWASTPSRSWVSSAKPLPRRHVCSDVPIVNGAYHEARSSHIPVSPSGDGNLQRSSNGGAGGSGGLGFGNGSGFGGFGGGPVGFSTANAVAALANLPRESRACAA